VIVDCTAFHLVQWDRERLQGLEIKESSMSTLF
jgi:hypothetical protein